MNGSKIAIDTNQVIYILNNCGDLSWLEKYNTILLPVIVIGELYFGALQSKNKKENFYRLDKIIEKCEILGITLATSKIYAQIRFSLKKMGKPIPENDIWIAAICIEYNVPLATLDKHFNEIEGLKIITV